MLTHNPSVETIAKKEMPLIEEEIISFKCVHWDVFEWSKLDHRVLGPVFEAGGHDWYYKSRQEK